MSSPTAKLIIAICLLVPLLVVLNLGLWSALRRRNSPNRTKMIQQARTSVTHPWQSEDQSLKELSDRVAEIRNRGQPERQIDPDEQAQPGDLDPMDKPQGE